MFTSDDYRSVTGSNFISESHSIDEAKLEFTRRAGAARDVKKTGEEKALNKADRLSNSQNPRDRQRANKIRKTAQTVADRDAAQASSNARQKLYRSQQRRANDLAHQLIQAKKGNLNAGYEPEGEYLHNEAKDETEIGITGKPIPKKKMSPAKRYEFEKKRRENLGTNVGGVTYSSDTTPYHNPRTIRNHYEPMTYSKFMNLIEEKKEN